jgi:hypothetical protein
MPAGLPSGDATVDILYLRRRVRRYLDGRVRRDLHRCFSGYFLRPLRREPRGLIGRRLFRRHTRWNLGRLRLSRARRSNR